MLETFGAKKAQLDTVIECAKTWKFPLDGDKWELVWDGKVEDASYQHVGAENRRGMSAQIELDDGYLGQVLSDEDGVRPWISENPTVVVRIIRFRRARVH